MVAHKAAKSGEAEAYIWALHYLFGIDLRDRDSIPASLADLCPASHRHHEVETTVEGDRESAKE